MSSTSSDIFLTTSSNPVSSQSPENDGVLPSSISFDVLFVGTGVSIGIPFIQHHLTGECSVCCDSVENPQSKNRRNNVSIALRVHSGAQSKIVLVDAGKTFRDAVLRQFPKHNIRVVNSVLFTHDHADATLGIDDIRDFQRKEDAEGGYRVVDGPLDVFLNQHCMSSLVERFGYLTKAPPFLDKARGLLQRNVAWLEYHVIDNNSQFETCGLPVRAFPVFHGGDYVSLGFNFGRPGQFVYISDVKVIPDATMNYLSSIMPIETLVLDCLQHEDHFSHFNFNEALACIHRLKPKKAYFVGMSCFLGDHDEINQLIKSRGFDNVELAFDGLMLTGFSSNVDD